MLVAMRWADEAVMRGRRSQDISPSNVYLLDAELSNVAVSLPYIRSVAKAI